MSAGVRMIENPPSAIELAEMDDVLLDPGGPMQPLTATEIRRRYRHDAICVWAQTRGRYLLPTIELVLWLRTELGGAAGFPDYPRALEIGAGMGDLGRHVGVRMTDSGVQQRADLQALYAAAGCAVTKPPADVERLDAIAAAKRYKPHTIVAAWVTQSCRRDEKPGTGCMFGVDESHLLNLCKRYVFIGNENVHKDKRILREPHTTFKPPWIVSRASDPSADVIWIWER